MLQAALRLSDDKKRRIVENRRRLLLNLEALLRKQNMVRPSSRPHLTTLNTQSPEMLATSNALQPATQYRGRDPGQQHPVRKSQICSNDQPQDDQPQHQCLRLQVVELLQNSMPLRYDDLTASQAFLKATVAVFDLTADLHKHHGAVRDFMRELLSSVTHPAPAHAVAGLAVSHGSGREPLRELMPEIFSLMASLVP